MSIKDTSQYFHPQANPDASGEANKLIDWTLSEDDKAGSQIVLDGVDPASVPAFVNHGFNLELFGQSDHGNYQGDAAPKELLSQDLISPTRVDAGASDVSAPVPGMEFLSPDEEVRTFISNAQQVGEKLSVRDIARAEGMVDHSSEDLMAKPVPAGSEVNVNVSSSDPVLTSLRSGEGSEVPNVKS